MTSQPVLGKMEKQAICDDGLPFAVLVSKRNARYCDAYCNGVLGNAHCTNFAIVGTAGSHSPAYQSHDFSRQQRIKRLLTLSRRGGMREWGGGV